jgi:RNA recognition motif-containing protein
MKNKIYVGNLNYDTEEVTLRELFQEHGTVSSINIITDRYTGLSKGFGFVEMGTPEEAQAAVSALDGREVDGRTLKVNEAHDKPRRDFKRY